MLRSGLWRPLFALAAVSIAAYLLHRAANQYSFEAIAASIRGFSPDRLALVGLFAAASYGCLTCFDALAVRYVGGKVPYPYVAMTSFTSLSLGHNIGFAALSSGTIRYRFYARYGLSAIDIAGVIVFCGLTVGLGLITLGGLALSSRPHLAADVIGIRPSTAIALGAASLAGAAVYVLICAVARRPFSFRRWRMTLPTARLALAQLVVGPINFALVAACLHQAIGGAGDVPYLAVAAVYVLANIAALISHVPGGLGVIESVVLVLIPGEAVVGALIVFRLAYFLIPLVLGTALFAVAELTRSPTRTHAQS